MTDAADLRSQLRAAAHAAQAFVAEAKGPVKAKVTGANGKVDRAAADREQHAVHGFGWYATYAEVMTQMSAWADHLAADGRFGEIEQLICQVVFGEYGAQMVGGIPMNQGEMVRPFHVGLTQEHVGKFWPV